MRLPKSLERVRMLLWCSVLVHHPMIPGRSLFSSFPGVGGFSDKKDERLTHHQQWENRRGSLRTVHVARRHVGWAEGERESVNSSPG